MINDFEFYYSRRQLVARRWRRLLKNRNLRGYTVSGLWLYKNQNLIQLIRGWKIHISASIETICDVIQMILPWAESKKLPFKIIRSPKALQRLNAGLVNLPQVGKAITIYTSGQEQLHQLCLELKAMNLPNQAPQIIYDHQPFSGHPIYLRYGNFRANVDQFDCRTDWHLSAPILHPSLCHSLISPPIKNWKGMACIVHRGKGSVYFAVKEESSYLTTAIMKEGRSYGEMDWDCTDGQIRLINELRLLKILEDTNCTPKVYDSIISDHGSYICIEHIQGASLQEILISNPNLPISLRKKLAYECALLLARIHENGIVWRDMKPANIILSEIGEMFAIDFEGGYLISEFPTAPWGTKIYSPPDFLKRNRGISQDYYSLAVTILQIFASNLLGPEDNFMKAKLMMDMDLTHAISCLLACEKSEEYTARSIANLLILS